MAGEADRAMEQVMEFVFLLVVLGATAGIAITSGVALSNQFSGSSFAGLLGGGLVTLLIGWFVIKKVMKLIRKA
jgi:hypothetical protein